MAILKEKTNYKEGSVVKASTINDTVETALEAYKAATDAKQYVETTVGEFITSTLNTEV